jgi:hypothetical protein
MLKTNVLTQMEIARRSPVWWALSDLFLDTELQPHDHRHIAEVIRRAGYSFAEAEAILRNEVAPVFITNLLSMAGEWVSWPEDFVRDRIMEHLEKRRGSGMLRRAVAQAREAASSRFAASFVRNDWRKVRSLLAEQS